MAENKFWEKKPLTNFTAEEWENICMHCGKCCLLKLQDEDSQDIFYTDVVCRYFDSKTCQCTEYTNRCTLVPSCLKLTKDNISEISWMPQSCAYRFLAEGKGLPAYHPLLTGHSLNAKWSIKGLTVPETEVAEDELEDHIIGESL